MRSAIIGYIILAIFLLISIGLHEYAHAYVSYKLGDPTPKLQGRLTTNPLKHIDIIGFISVFLIGVGRGKPVQVNPAYYKDPVKGEIMVAFAGPIMNLILAIIGIFIIVLFAKIGGLGPNDIFTGNHGIIIDLIKGFCGLNIGLAVFNMIPIPPLDGFRIIKIISVRFAESIEKYTSYIAIVFLLLLIGPGSNIIGNYISRLTDIIFNFITTIFTFIFF